MFLQKVRQKPAHVLSLSGPRAVSLPALLDRRLRDLSLSEVPLLRALRAALNAGQEQRHIKGFAHDRPPM